MTGLKKCQKFNETLKFLSFLSPIQTLTISEWFWRLQNTVRIDTNRFWTGLIIPNLPNSTFSKLKTWKSENLKIWKRRAPKNNRYLSGQKCFNFRGVLIGDKTDCKTDTWELEISLGNFRMGTFAPGSQAWGTGLLRLGEPADGNWGNPGAPSPLPAL